MRPQLQAVGHNKGDIGMLRPLNNGYRRAAQLPAFTARDRLCFKACKELAGALHKVSKKGKVKTVRASFVNVGGGQPGVTHQLAFLMSYVDVHILGGECGTAGSANSLLPTPAVSFAICWQCCRSEAYVD